MNVLIRSAKVIDTRSSHHGQEIDLFISGGKIAEIGHDLNVAADREIIAKQLHISSGWIDLRANFRDPGSEHQETLLTGIRAAQKGGYSRVVLMPSVSPPVDSKQGIEYLISKCRNLSVLVYPTGTISKGLKGIQLAELYDMHLAGAVAFGDDKSPVSSELMVRALEYARNFDGLVFSFPFDLGVNPGGMMHEGITSVEMGVQGLPSLSEEIQLHRDLKLLELLGGRMHVSLISAAGSVDLIRQAKQRGQRVTCSVAAHQLLFTDTDLADFDSTFKVLPPFRTESDRRALIGGLTDGTIDAICSDHSPEDPERKELEWDQAAYGMSSIETTFCAAYTALEKEMSIENIVRLFTSGPAAALGIQQPVIERGETAELTLFSSASDTLFSADQWMSRSRNNPFIGKSLRGQVIEWK